MKTKKNKDAYNHLNINNNKKVKTMEELYVCCGTREFYTWRQTISATFDVRRITLIRSHYHRILQILQIYFLLKTIMLPHFVGFI